MSPDLPRILLPPSQVLNLAGIPSPPARGGKGGSLLAVAGALTRPANHFTSNIFRVCANPAASIRQR